MSFFSRSSRDTSPLLPQHRDSVSLADLSPRPSASTSRSRAASPSPPPSFYRDDNALRDQSPRSNPNPSLSPSPSRTKTKRIQFAAPPPPIATSVLLSPAVHGVQGTGRTEAKSASPRIKRGGGSVIDPLIILERREKAIQGDLQLLLDAQSAGLIQGFGGEGDGHSDAGSSTPTTRSVQGKGSGGIVPVRQPKKKVVGLRGARRGLLRCMGELVGVKREEMGILMVEIGRREEVLGKVSQWETRIEGMRSQLSEANGKGAGEDAMEIADLRTEGRALDSEIRDLEDRLAQMKARKRWLGERISEGVNRQEARLSSYRGALKEVESEVKEFLKRPPVTVSVVMGDEAGIFALPVGRRTLGMAKEWWNKEISQLQIRKQEVETEKTALEDGAQMWQESIKMVMDFEDNLRQEMASNDAQDPEMLRAHVSKMGTVVQKLQETLTTAEERNWNLLICAVGAELEAFKEGEGILNGALEMIQGGKEEQPQVHEVHEGHDGHDEAHDDESQHSLSTNALLEELNGGPITRQNSEEREESEDDSPNLAELLVDRGDHGGN